MSDGLGSRLCGYTCIGRTIGCISVLTFFIGGIASMISASAICWVVAIYMFLVSLVIGTLELPLLFQFVKFMQPLSKRVDKFKSGHRALLYLLLSIFPFFCIGVSSLLAALLLIGCAFFYGMDWLGPRGGRKGPAQGQPAAGTTSVAAAAAKPEDKRGLIAAHEQETEADKEYPWDKFMNKVGEAAGKAVATAVVNQAVASVSGPQQPQQHQDVRIDMTKK